MKELVEYITKFLVDKPEQVDVKEIDGATLNVIEVKTAPEDSGKVIGREGRIANAIRTIVKAAAAKQQKKVNVEIITEDKQRGGI
ncbi:MAG: KH domain-containing protein [Candidatus Margulisbacteria bacterium]|nr:KH domain-containing protein [Candidatus Margulisiibacteriota bacterium]MBU1617413.1 KH domain-containing protein [Candidatus Margulisiibacteriota bacterium]